VAAVKAAAVLHKPVPAQQKKAVVVPVAAKGAKPVIAKSGKGAAVTVATPAPAAANAPAAAPVKGKRGRGAGKAEAEALSTIERRAPVMPEERQSQLKLLIALGKEQSFLTYSQVNDHLPSEIVDPEQIEDIVQMINDMGIPVYEKAPDAEALLLREPVVADEEAAEEAAAAFATTVDAEFGRTTDPVRMYMREMGTVELLTREGEIDLAKRIEDGVRQTTEAIAACPAAIAEVVRMMDLVEIDQMRLTDLVVDFVDPNATELPLPEVPSEKAAADVDDDEENGPATVAVKKMKKPARTAKRR
jgi:hypothetical protein